MEVTDKKLLAEVEFKQGKIARMKKRWIKRQNNVFGKLISFKDHLTNKQADIVISETKGIYGRSGNRIYKNGVLFNKFKNATKAKKFMRKQ